MGCYDAIKLEENFRCGIQITGKKTDMKEIN